ncbi:hypothetical protein QWY82_13480 [Simiduia curdlanivorans]|uniref:Shikimate kinase n=1 Tax=Simiduia curdlanivorans TaxID=1492769 RepID=A0ABV8V7H1_9GAMM|nr:hypothetical protein [Simiduia curdlanivorans]MDN3639811.1 hypothetical protein [Simiduia curdlanivorans]
MSLFINFPKPSLYFLFQVFKYAIYSLLVVNLYFFFQENTAAIAHTFSGGVPIFQLGEAYSDSIDTLSWVLLLLLFELETYIVSDKYLTNRVKLALFSLRTLSYIFIFYSLYGYISRYIAVMAASPFSIADACELVNTSFTQIISLNEYQPLSAASCNELNGVDMMRLNGTEIIGSVESYNIIENLAVVDVINALTWVLIVVVLEIDVYLQTSKRVMGPFLALSSWIKAGLYGTLLACAIYWWIDGDFLDFWDAFLWLIAFVFIELNIFEWQEEIQKKSRHSNQAA